MSEPLVVVNNLVKHFDVSSGFLWTRKKRYVKAVDGLEFEVAPGETLGLVGESGSGKSTVARLLLQLEEATSGEITFAGETMKAGRSSDLKKLRRNMQMVFQDPYASLNPRMTVGDSITEALTVFGIGSRSDRRERAAQLLAEVGLDPSYIDRYPHEFSGGQRQRVGIARALAIQPKLIVCDEAVSALDVSVQAQVINLLQDLQEKYGLTYIFISHDLSVIKHISTRIAVMYLGKIVESGPKAAVFSNPRHPYTRALLEAVPDVHSDGMDEGALIKGEVPSPINMPSGCRFRTRCPMATDLCAAEAPPTIEVSPDHKAACHYL
jgi:oligopeptide/dipeptide ABC transporter ATP-binding protein